MIKKGESIIETVIATAIISIAIVAALALVNYTQKQASYAKALNQAVDFNTQATDWLRQEKAVMGWAAYKQKLSSDGGGGTATYCLNSLPADSGAVAGFTTLSPGPCAGSTYISGTLMTRSLTIDLTGIVSGMTTATVTVSWTDTSPRQNTSTVELYQWN